MFYDIVQVIPNEDYTVYVYFEDGKIVCYDAKTLLKKKVFEPLKDINFFMNACTILNGTLAWDVTGTRDCTKYCLSCYYICIRNYNERVAITAYTYISASYLRYAFNQRVIKKQ